jgi:S-adenosylmethionine:tRNA ribosyltransferase-isomerase
LVPRAGIEPARCHHHRILNPARLPVPPPRQRSAIISRLDLKYQSILVKIKLNWIRLLIVKKSDFSYQLPEYLIAQTPLPERDASRLLCLNKTTGKLLDKKFSDFIDMIEATDLLVFNDTKVIPARLYGLKATGGKVEILIERILDDHQAIAHVKASKSMKQGAEIQLDNDYCCTVVCREEDLFKLEFHAEKPIMEIIEEIGHVPLPPYIERADNQTDVTRYQSVFALHVGAVAAPTASLHFDLKMMEKIKAKGATINFVTLHVGSGTFQPVRVEELSKHRMHTEYYAVSHETVETIEKTRLKGGRVIAVGTTAVRALESASKTGRLEAGFGDTDLFITPGYHFNAVDAMVTNFHLSESTLLMLVAAFAGYQPVMNAYQHAIEQGYRFFSYGDAMFITK